VPSRGFLYSLREHAFIARLFRKVTLLDLSSSIKDILAKILVESASYVVCYHVVKWIGFGGGEIAASR